MTNMYSRSTSIGIGSLFCTLLLVTVCWAPHAFAAKWGITQYEIEQPDGEYFSAQQVNAIETYMNRVAQFYEKQGWPQPRHEAINDSNSAFLVEVAEYSDGAGPPRALTDCNNPATKTKIYIDPREWGQTPNKDWQDLAHEMFHTIQYNYPAFNRDCNNGQEPGQWVLEGTAEAVGIEAARVVGGVNPYHFCQIGMRDYGSALFIKNNKKGALCPSESYATKSFWQFLGEWKAGDAYPTPQKFTPPNYAYLDKLFRKRPSSFGAKAEYQWLDQSIKESFGFDLRRAYSGFAAAFSGYYEHRKNRYPALSASSIEGWHKQIYGECKAATISPAKFNVALSIEAIASRCVKAHFLTAGQHNVEMVANGNVEQLRALTISVGNGMQRVEPIMKPAGKPTKAHFNFVVNINAPGVQYFVVSNAANNPQNTVKTNILLDMISATVKSTSASPAQENQTSQNTTAAKKKADTAEAYAEEYEQNMKSESWRGSVEQRSGDSSCDGAFVKTVCGPRTEISLQLVSDEITAMAEAAENASLGTLIKRGEALKNQDGVMELVEQSNRLADIEGSSVTIVMPRIEFGYSGSVNNAYIRMNKPISDKEGADHYDTKGPKWEGDCDDGYHAYSGQVTIEEATELGLSGTYQATVVDPDLRGKYFCRSVPVYKTISGSFVIADPSLGDKKEDGELAEGTGDYIVNEIAEQVPGLISPEMRELIRAKAEAAEEAKEQRRRDKAAAAELIKNTCDCSCLQAGVNIQKTGCYQQCEAEYEHCTTPTAAQIQQMYDMTREPTTGETAHHDQMRNEIIEFLATEPKRYVRESWLQQFDQAPPVMKQAVYDNVKARYSK